MEELQKTEVIKEKDNKTVNIKLEQIAFGIRYLRSWRVLDILGDITDKILRDDKSPFASKPDYFTKVTDEITGRARKLFNPDTDCSLQINIDDIIFNHILDKEIEELKDKDLNWFFKSIIEFLIPKIIRPYEFKQIIRMGIVYYHQVNEEKILKEFISKVVEYETEISKFNLDFHTKIPVERALVKKGLFDYKNAIYSIKSKNRKYQISLDYQYYFDPYTDNYNDLKIDNFIGTSQNYLKNKFYPWLRKKFTNLCIKET